jgi:hypothetical protein
VHKNTPDPDESSVCPSVTIGHQLSMLGPAAPSTAKGKRRRSALRRGCSDYNSRVGEPLFPAVVRESVEYNDNNDIVKHYAKTQNITETHLTKIN